MDLKHQQFQINSMKIFIIPLDKLCFKPFPSNEVSYTPYQPVNKPIAEISILSIHTLFPRYEILTSRITKSSQQRMCWICFHTSISVKSTSLRWVKELTVFIVWIKFSKYSLNNSIVLFSKAFVSWCSC